jgi:CRISPR-associated exonuclease Cas4
MNTPQQTQSVSGTAGRDDYPPLSSLNHLLFCPRRCALLRTEGAWVDNAHTVEGTHAHRNVHANPGTLHEDEGVRVARGLWVWSDRLRLAGVADLVEFRPGPYPVEYKRGRRRRWDNDDVQLCAQALCLEEMFGTPVPAGAVFNVRSRRRREVLFDAPLRAETEGAVARLHALLASGETPPPVPHPKCKQCSLERLCLPRLVADQAAYRQAARTLFRIPLA